MRVSDKCIVKVPQSFENAAFDPTWLSWARSHDNLEVKLNSCSSQGAFSHPIPGWTVFSDISVPLHPKWPTLRVISWFPDSWLHPSTAAAITKTCDCSSRKLFQQGCKGH